MSQDILQRLQSSGPDEEELLQLLEKQDGMMASMEEEMLMCREHIKLLTERDRDKNESELASIQMMEEAHKKVEVALTTVQALQAHNERLEHELSAMKRKTVDEQPIPSVMQLRENLKKTEFELECQKRSFENALLQQRAERERREEVEHCLEECRRAKQEYHASMSAKIETLSKNLADMITQHQALQSSSQIESNRTSGELAVLRQKIVYAEDINKMMLEELATCRKAKSFLNSRQSTLLEENARLRTKVLKQNLCEHAEHVTMDYDEHIKKLLADQSHLIAALREEGAMLADRLDFERKERKVETKNLKKTKRELERRIEKLLLV